MKLITLVLIFAFSSLAQALVSGPSALKNGISSLTLGYQIERGKIEPNENRASYQDAKIDIYKIKYGHGFENTSLGIEYGEFTSAEEKIGPTLFYKQDKGRYLSINLSTELIHETDKIFGLYFQISPLRDYNINKFSNPRLDILSIGFFSALNITENIFQKNLLSYGSGDGSGQNSSLAIDTGFGYRMNSLIEHPTILSASLFIEADTSQRTDTQYDAAFSAPGTSDRIRAFKYGSLLKMELTLTASSYINFSYLQKLGGYDARSTQISNFNLGVLF